MNVRAQEAHLSLLSRLPVRTITGRPPAAADTQNTNTAWRIRVGAKIYNSLKEAFEGEGVGSLKMHSWLASGKAVRIDDDDEEHPLDRARGSRPAGARHLGPRKTGVGKIRDVNGVKMKRCCRCTLDKTLGAFTRGSGPGGLHRYCKPCQAAWRRERARRK